MTQERLWKTECPYCRSPETFCIQVYPDCTDWICWNCLIFFKYIWAGKKFKYAIVEPNDPKNQTLDVTASEWMFENAGNMVRILKNTMWGWLNEHYYHPRFWHFLVSLDRILTRYLHEFQNSLLIIEKAKQNKPASAQPNRDEQGQNPPPTQ